MDVSHLDPRIADTILQVFQPPKQILPCEEMDVPVRVYLGNVWRWRNQQKRIQIQWDQDVTDAGHWDAGGGMCPVDEMEPDPFQIDPNIMESNRMNSAMIDRDIVTWYDMIRMLLPRLESA
jgi:hypothetical protein